MKTTRTSTLLRTGIALALALAAWLPAGAGAAEDHSKMKGGEHLTSLNRLETRGQADALKTDDTLAMVCAKCRTVYVTRVKQGVKGAEILQAGGQPKELIGTHACAGCNSTMTITGVGKGKEAVYKHSCGSCGDDSAFCCATKPGSKATKGMEKEKK